MKVRLPSFYEIEHLRDDGEVRKRAQVGFVDIEIPELRNSDVEIAATWIVSGEDEESAIECLVHSGDLYLPTLSRDLRLIAPDQLQELRHTFEFQGGYSRPPGAEVYAGVINGYDRPYYLDQWFSGNRQLFARPRGGAVLSSTESEDAGRLQFLADRTFILNDKVYQRATGLHCEVFVGENRYGDEITFGDLDYSKDDGNSWVRAWRPRGSRWSDELRISLNDLRPDQMLDGQMVRHQFHRLAIHKPEAFEFDGRSWYLDRFARQVLLQSKSHVGGWSAENVARWLNLRGIVERANGFTLGEALPILEALSETKLNRSAEWALECGFAGWKKLDQLIPDTEREISSSHAFVGKRIGRDLSF